MLDSSANDFVYTCINEYLTDITKSNTVDHRTISLLIEILKDNPEIIDTIEKHILEKFPSENTDFYIIFLKKLYKKIIVSLSREISKKDLQIGELKKLYETISNINRLMFTSDSLNNVFPEAANILVEKGRFSAVTVNQYIKKEGRLKPLYIYGNQDILKSIPGNLSLDLDNKRIKILSQKDFKTYMEFYNVLKKEKIKSIIFVPVFSDIRHGKDISFVLSVYSTEDLSDINIEFFKELSHNLSATYERISKGIDFFKTDNITSLPTRDLFIGEIYRTINTNIKNGRKFALILIDLDNFKLINEKFGYNIGDILLKSISRRIENTADSNDFLSRIGSDEFGILFKDFNNESDIVSFISRLKESFNIPFVVGKEKFFITFSTGISIFPDDAQNTEKLMLSAELALEKAKVKGGNTCFFFRETLSKKTFEILRTESQLKTALKNREFEVFYQPKINIETNQVIGAEALLRWRKNRKIIPPSNFIPVLEKSGLIKEAGLFVLKQVSYQIIKWQTAGINIPVSINVSPIQIEDKNFLQNMKEVLKDYPQVTDKLEFEITETALMENIDKSSKIIEELLSYGIKTSIDDFGTGYSSLLYLKKLPVFALKIDKEFIKDIHKNQDDFQIVKAIINLANNFGIQVIAEGIENKTQLNVIRFLGCKIVQGYFFSRPLPPERFESYLASYSSKTKK